MVDVVTVQLKARAGGSQGADGQNNKDDILKFFYHTGVVDSGDGSDVLKFYGTSDVTIFGGSGDDRIDLVEVKPYSTVEVDGGQGIDVLDLPAGTFNSLMDWSAVSGVEWLRLWSGKGPRRSFVITDEMFSGIEDLTISGVGRFRSTTIDGSAVSAGGLTLVGFAFGNTLIGGGLDDVLVGQAGDDWFTGGAGDDAIDGGKETDRAIFSGDMANYSIAYDYAAGTLTVIDNVGNDGADVLRRIERLQFADQVYVVIDQDSTLVGTRLDDKLEGGTGGDRINGKGGDDRIFGEYGNDSLYGGAGDDIVMGEVGDDWIYGGHGDDDMNGQEGSDILLGGAGDDDIEDRGLPSEYSTVNGGAGDDRIIVQGGNVLILGGEGLDKLGASEAVGTIDGGNGNDWIYFGIATSPEIADPSLLLIGGEGNDTFVGDLDDGVTVLGGNGDDTIVGYHGSSGYLVDLGAGTDSIYINWYADERIRLDWAAIQNAEVIELRPDRFHTGGPPLALLDDDMFANRDRWVVTAEYEKEKPIPGGFKIDASDVTAGYLEIIGRSMGKETLLGGALDDTLRGLSGDDFLSGNGGDDLLDGGDGYDFVTYDGQSADYAIERQSGQVVVTALDGDDGIDTLVHVEVIRFDDKLIAL